MLELRATLSADPEQVAEARRLVAGYLAERGDDDGEVAVLLTSELVTNAILYGRAPLELRAQADGAALRVEVHDLDPTSPPVLRYDVDLIEIGGRGLQLVDTLADRWGWAENDYGKVVWFELDA
jgi:anti-sigma regulatory factor (Ser/Thr protein kinase)